MLESASLSPASVASEINAAAAAFKRGARGFCRTAIRDLSDSRAIHARYCNRKWLHEVHLTSTLLGDTAMRIQIEDNNENWLNWGNLVQAWLRKTKARPGHVGDLKSQLADHQVGATVSREG